VCGTLRSRRPSREEINQSLPARAPCLSMIGLRASPMSASSQVNLSQQTAGSLGWEAVGRIGQQLGMVLSTAVLARVLAPSAYGMAGMAAVFINFASTFSQLGIPGAIVQKARTDDDELSSLFWFNMAVGIALSLALTLAAPAAARFFREPLVRALLSVLAWTFAVNALGNVQHALFYRGMDLRRPALAQVGVSLCTFLVALFMALRGFGVWSLVVSSLAGRVVDSALMWVLHPWRPRLVMRWAHFRAVANFGLSVSAFGVVNYFFRNGDNLIVGRALGPAALGYYQNAYSLMFYPFQAVTSLASNVMLSPLARVADQMERFRAAVLRISAFMALALYPVMFGLLVTSDLVVALALGSRWHASAHVLIVLAAGGIVNSTCAALGSVILARGRGDVMLWFGVLQTAVSLGAFTVGTRWGIEGVAAGFSVASLFGLVQLVFVLRMLQIPVASYCRALAPVLLAAAGMAASVELWRNALAALGLGQLWLHAATSIPLGGAVYALLTVRLCPTTCADVVALFGAKIPALRAAARFCGLRN
jgi:O-antigen/teichoic acid export membrane protein